MPEKKKLITICVPVFNEEQNVEPLYQALVPVMTELSGDYDFELLFTDNHSTDCTFQELEQLAARDPRVRVIRFSRNFGFQRSIFTAALMNATRKFFYRVIDSLSEDELPLDAGDFRLLDRRVLDELKKFEDYQPYVRGTVAALGFDQIGIPYDRTERQRGESKFSFRELIGLALDGILNHSIVPLRIATYLGLAISLITFLGIVAYAVGRLFFGRDWPPGFATIIILILGSLSLNALFLGIIGEYLGRIYKQVKRRPLTIIEREINPAAVRSEQKAGTRSAVG